MPVSSQRVTIFEADDQTPLLGSIDGAGNITDPTASTDPAHARPYLEPIRGRPKRSIDLLAGKAQIGQTNIRILDKRTAPSDQDTGWFTALLSDNGGRSALNGRRILIQAVDGGDPYKLFDGIIRGISIEFGELTTYTITVRDFRERLRKVESFNWTDSTIIFPAGFKTGSYPQMGLSDPPQFVTGTFLGAGEAVHRRRGYVDLGEVDTGQIGVLEYEDMRMSTDLLTEFTQPTRTYSPDGVKTVIEFSNHRVEWRVAGSGDPWTVIERPQIEVPDSWRSNYAGGSYDPAIQRNRNELIEYVEESDDWWARYIYIGTQESAQWPDHGTEIDIRITWRGPATEATPQHLFGPFNEVIPRILDGYYFRDEDGNPIDPRIPYDQAAFDRFSRYTVVGRILEPIGQDEADGRRALLGWLEKNAFQPLGLAPALNADDELAPVSMELPDAEAVVQLDDSNVLSMDWEDSTEHSINRIAFKYQQPTRPRVVSVQELTALDQMNTREQVVVVSENDLLPTASQSTTLLGENTLEINTALFAPVPNAPGPYDTYISPSAELNQVQRMAARLGYAAFDRFLLGGQYFSGVVSRAAGLEVGDWVVLAVSWLPDYRTGSRGLNRIAQVVDVAPNDELTVAVELVDAGTSMVPLSQPTISAAAASATGVVTLTIGSIPQDASYEHPTTARIEVAQADVEPAATDGAWELVGRYESVGEVVGPVLAPGTFWVRTRGEAPGRIPSPWNVYGPYTVPERAALAGLRVAIADDGGVRFVWEPAYNTEGVEIVATQHGRNEEPDFDAPTLPVVEQAAGNDSKTYERDDMMAQERFSIRVTPYTGWDGANVSGVAGTSWQTTVDRAAIVHHMKPPLTSLSAVFVQTDPDGNSSIYAQGEAGFWTAGVILRLYGEDDTLLQEETGYADPTKQGIGEKDHWSHRIIIEPLFGDQILRVVAVPTADASLAGDAGGWEGEPAEVALYIASADINEPVRTFIEGPTTGRTNDGVLTGDTCNNILEPGLDWLIDGMRPGDTVSVKRRISSGTLIAAMAERSIGHVVGGGSLLGSEWQDNYPETFTAETHVDDVDGVEHSWDYLVIVRNSSGAIVASQATNLLTLNLAECVPVYESVSAAPPTAGNRDISIDLNADLDNSGYEYEVHAEVALDNGVDPVHTTNYGNVSADLNPALPSGVQDAVFSTSWDSGAARDDAGGTQVTVTITAYIKRKSDGAIMDTASDTAVYNSNTPVPGGA